MQLEISYSYNVPDDLEVHQFLFKDLIAISFDNFEQQ